MSFTDYIKYFCFLIKNTILSCLGLLENTLERSRSMSTHGRFSHDGEEELEKAYKDAVLVVRRTNEPFDILWKNMRGSRGLFIFRRLILTVIGFVVIFFVSSPTVLFSKLLVFDEGHYFDFVWSENESHNSFWKEHIPPLIIIAINQLLIYLIDVASLFEAHETHSLYQRAYYKKAVIFLIVNMLIIPAWTLSQSSEASDLDAATKQVRESQLSLFNFVIDRGFDFTQLMSEFYIGDNGTFFVSLIIQQAVFTTAFYLMQFSDLAFSYFSPWLVNMKRKVYQDQEPWLRKEGNNFYYGYFYAQMMTIFAICVFFSATIPLVSLATAFFCLIKHWLDCFLLLNNNRKEIDSQGDLIESVTNTALVIIVSY